MRRLLLLKVSTLCFVAVKLFANQIIHDETTFYPVSGQTFEEVFRDVDAKTTIEKDGKKYQGLTTWDTNHKFEWKMRNSFCVITSATITVNITITMPKWSNYNNAKRRDQKEWDKYFSHLMSHENGHREIAIQSAYKLEKALFTLHGRKNDDLLKSDANALAGQIMQRCVEANQKYDSINKHGTRY